MIIPSVLCHLCSPVPRFKFLCSVSPVCVFKVLSVCFLFYFEGPFLLSVFLVSLPLVSYVQFPVSHSPNALCVFKPCVFFPYLILLSTCIFLHPYSETWLGQCCNAVGIIFSSRNWETRQARGKDKCSNVQRHHL